MVDEYLVFESPRCLDSCRLKTSMKSGKFVLVGLDYGTDRLYKCIHGIGRALPA